MTFKPCPWEFGITLEDFGKVLDRLHAQDKAEYYNMADKLGTRRRWIPYLREYLKESGDWRKMEKYSEAMDREEEKETDEEEE